jgi:hypothetical protein
MSFTIHDCLLPCPMRDAFRGADAERIELNADVALPESSGRLAGIVETRAVVFRFNVPPLVRVKEKLVQGPAIHHITRLFRVLLQ